MNFFTFDLRKLVLFLVVIAVPLVSINVQRKTSETLWFVKPFSFLTGLVQEGYSSFSSGVRGTTALYLDLIDVKKDNRILLKENQEMRAKLGTMTELELENRRLNELLGFKQRSIMSLLAAKVVGKDLLTEHLTITINRGIEHGVKKNMAVVTVAGVVGYIFRAERLSSHVMLLTDRYAAIDAITQRSRSRGIVEGHNRDACLMHYLRRDDDVKIGDMVVTSGLNNIFPKGFPIGTVTSIKKSRFGMSQEVEIKPVVNALNLEEVFVVLNANNEDFSAPVAGPSEDEAARATGSVKKGN